MRSRRALVAAAATLLILSGAAVAARTKFRPGTQGSGRFTLNLSALLTNVGVPSGSATYGLESQGSFAFKVSKRAATQALRLQRRTGIPFSAIEKGGSYAAVFNTPGNNTFKGIAVIAFRAPGLGKACVNYWAVPAPYQPGQLYIPMMGAFGTTGGTGKAARWAGYATFTQTSQSGLLVDLDSFVSNLKAWLTHPRPMSSACRQLAAQLH